MAALTNQPSNPQFLSPIGFNFSIKKIPTVNYFLQAANLPGVQLGEAEMQTPFRQIPFPGDHLTYGEFAITFKVDENMENYVEMYNWLQYLGYPESFAQSKQVYDTPGLKGLSGVRDVQRTVRSIGDGGVSDATLTILNSASNPNMSVVFEDCFPTSLSDIQFDVRATDVDFVEAQCTFRYKLHKLFRITGSGNSNTSVRITG